MHRRSLLIGLFASVSVVATMSAAAEALAARASGLAVGELEEFSSQFFGFFGFRGGRRRRYGRRGSGRRYVGRRRRGGGGGGGGREAPVEAPTASRAPDPILSTTKPVPLSDQPPPVRAPASR